MKLTDQEGIFLLNLLTDKLSHPMKLGWVNPMDKNEVFSHQQIEELSVKIITEGLELNVDDLMKDDNVPVI
jgi:hypothetical protein